MMSRETRLALQLLVEKTHRILDGPYVQWLREQGGTTLKYSYARDSEDGDGSIAVQHAHPDDGATDALMLTFRFFIQENESPSFRWLAKNVMNDDGLSDDWKVDFTRVRMTLNKFLDRLSPYNEVVIAPATLGTSEPGRIVEERRWTYREIMNVFIYGGMAHANLKKREIYARWKSNTVGFPFVVSLFDNVVINGIRAVAVVCSITERELASQGL